MKRMVSLAAALALLGLACFKEEPPPPKPEPTSPAVVLTDVAISFNQRNAELLELVLSTDFVFYFDPRDVGKTPPGKHYIIPESWSYNEFREAVNNMYNQAYSISLSIPTERVGTPGENETEYKAENISISLLVMIDSLNGFIADQGYCNFEFERYESAAGKKYWRLTGWWDRTSESFDEYPGVGPASLGKVLALFR